MRILQEVTTATARFYMAVLRPKPLKMVVIFPRTQPRLQHLTAVLRHLHGLQDLAKSH